MYLPLYTALFITTWFALSIGFAYSFNTDPDDPRVNICIGFGLLGAIGVVSFVIGLWG